ADGAPRCASCCIDTGPYCRTVINARQPLLVPDALEHEQWRSNPLTELGLISYLGVPISWPEGKRRDEHIESAVSGYIGANVAMVGEVLSAGNDPPRMD